MYKNLKPHSSCHCSDDAAKFLQIKLNNRCNGNCWFCIDKGNYSPHVIDIDEIVVATLAEEEYQVVSITGGEPFLDFEILLNLLNKIRPHKKEIIVNTNGSMISMEKIYELNGLIDELRVALHHYDEKINSNIIGTNICFSSIENALKHRKFKATFNMVITEAMDNDIGFIDKLTKLCHRLNVCGIKMSELKCVGIDDGYPQYAEGHIEAYRLFEHLNVIQYKDSKELINNGCIDTFAYNGIEFLVKRLCGYKIIPQTETFKVVYSNGKTDSDWIYVD